MKYMIDKFLSLDKTIYGYNILTRQLVFYWLNNCYYLMISVRPVFLTVDA